MKMAMEMVMAGVKLDAAQVMAKAMGMVTILLMGEETVPAAALVLDI
jgi:hypothetical protein